MIFLLFACDAGEKITEGTAPPAVLPDPAWVQNGHLAIPADSFASVDTPFPSDRLSWRTGFSPVQTAVVLLPGLDASVLGGQDVIGVDGPVQMWDLDTSSQIPMFAEQDAWPDAGDRAALLVRPQIAVPVGHTVAVVVREAACPSCVFDFSSRPDFAETMKTVEGLGVGDAVLAWSYPIGDGTAPLRSIPSALPEAYQLKLTDADVDGGLPDGLWRRLVGSYTVPNYLVNDPDSPEFVLDSEGLPQVQGTAEAELYVYVPDSLRDATPGSAPVLMFGHGILSEPERYFKDGDPSNVINLANQLQAIVVATVWRGLTYKDDLHAVEVAGDFGRIYQITDMMAQGQANTQALLRLIREGDLMADPALNNLADPKRLYYYGISLGSIEGAVFLSNQEQIQHAVLHVGGSSWSTMLERSSDWTAFEAVVLRTVPDPYDRQRLYAISQLFWDNVDPADYVDGLKGKTILWQESIGDDQVPNLSTELLMRSVGVPLATPAVTAPVDISTIALPTAAPAFTQFDPELGMPPAVNRPAPKSGAHEAPRGWDGTLQQTLDFFNPGKEGMVTDHCGGKPCSASNQGQ